MSGKTQFEGRTAEEAVARARKALGDSDALRCWKTRKGGVGGFFAREVFVASLTPPPGSEATGGKGSRGRAPRASDGRAPRVVSDGSARSFESSAVFQPPSGAPGDPEDHLSSLVDATSDQLSLHSLAIPADAFDQVLAEAQAALARLPEDRTSDEAQRPPALPEDDEARSEPACDGSATNPHKGQSTAGDKPAPPAAAGDGAEPTAKVKVPAKPKPKPKPKPLPRTKAPSARSTATEPPRPRRPMPRVGDLKSGLRSLGVPGPYLPPGRRPSLDLLAEVMETLPIPAALPTGAGSVIAVVGAASELANTVALVSDELSLGQRDVLQSAQDPGVHLDRQIARRRASGRRSVVAVNAVPGRSVGRETRECLEYVAPDYVLAAVSAGCKRADVEHWLGELPTVDALALWGLSGTRTPAELLGAAPIAFVDGEVGSPLGWTLFLAGRAVGWPQ